MREKEFVGGEEYLCCLAMLGRYDNDDDDDDEIYLVAQKSKSYF